MSFSTKFFILLSLVAVSSCTVETDSEKKTNKSMDKIRADLAETLEKYSVKYESVSGQECDIENSRTQVVSKIF